MLHKLKNVSVLHRNGIIKSFLNLGFCLSSILFTASIGRVVGRAFNILSLRVQIIDIPLNRLSVPFAGNAKGGSITVPLTSCLTGLD